MKMNNSAATITTHSQLKITPVKRIAKVRKMLTTDEEKVICLLSKHYTNFIIEYNGNKKSYQISAL